MKSLFEILISSKDLDKEFLEFMNCVFKTIEKYPAGCDIEVPCNLCPPKLVELLTIFRIPAYYVAGNYISLAATYIALKNYESKR